MTREEAIKLIRLNRPTRVFDRALTEACDMAIAALQDPERKKGRWQHLYGDEWLCTTCGHVINTEGSWDIPTAKYCEDCGAKNEGR